MKNQKQAPRERILQSAFQLFRDQGYTETGIAEILAGAGAYKKSLYDHFSTKEDLAGEYLRHLTVLHGDLITRVAESSNSLEHFVDRWVDLLRRNMRRSRRKDCPVGLFAAQVVSLPHLHADVKHTFRFLIQTMGRAILRFRPIDETRAEDLARRVFLIFQGGMRLFFLTGDELYLSIMREELKRCLTQDQG